MSSHACPSLEIEPARRVQAAIGVLSVVALAMVPWCLSIHWDWALTLSLALGGAGIVECRRVGWMARARRVERLTWTGSGAWYLYGAAGAQEPGELVRGWLFANGIAVLKLMGEFGTRWVLLTGRDSSQRRLAVRLRFEGVRLPRRDRLTATRQQGTDPDLKL